MGRAQPLIPTDTVVFRAKFTFHCHYRYNKHLPTLNCTSELSAFIVNELQFYVNMQSFALRPPFTLSKTVLWAYLFYIPGVLTSP
jgi:hypothetical protein